MLQSGAIRCFFLSVRLAQACWWPRPASANPRSKHPLGETCFFPGAKASAGTGRRKSRPASAIGNTVRTPADEQANTAFALKPPTETGRVDYVKTNYWDERSQEWANSAVSSMYDYTRLRRPVGGGYEAAWGAPGRYLGGERRHPMG